MAAERAAHRDPTLQATARACAALGIAIGGGALAVVVVPPLAERAGTGPDLGAGIALGLCCLLLAFGGAAVLGQRVAPGAGVAATVALPLGIGGFAAALGLCALGGHVAARTGAPFAGGYGIGLAVLLLGAFAEETLFRGFLQPLLCRAWGTAAGVPLAALGFMLLHLAGGWRAPLSLANIALAGLWFGVLAWRTGGIAAPLLAHAGWNWAEALLFGAFPNPGIDPAGSIFDVELGGAAWLGGSGDGMNGAAATTLVLAVLILLTARTGRRPAR